MEPSPPKRLVARRLRWVLVWTSVGVAVAAFFVGVWFSSDADDYKVDGVPFREWLSQKPDFEIKEPLARLGTNVLPHLIRIVRRSPESKVTFGIKQKIWRVLPGWVQARYPHLQPIPDWQVRRTALFAIRFLGEQGKTALAETVRAGRNETNRMVRASALVAALSVAPQAPETFEFWRDEWIRATRQTNGIPRRDLALYLHMARAPIPAATPYLLKEAADERSEARLAALEAFEYFGEAARPAVPRMVEVFEGNHYLDLLPVFERLGPIAIEAVPALSACLAESTPIIKQVYNSMSKSRVPWDERPALISGALAALRAMGPEAHAALPTVGPLLTNSDSTIRMLAAATQVRIGGPVDEAIAVLLAGLEGRLPGKATVHVPIKFEVQPGNGAGWATAGSEAAAILLGECGQAAHDALPALEQRLQSTEFSMRLASAQAIWRISGDAPKALPILVALLDSIPDPAGNGSLEDYKLVRTVEAIGEIGPGARDTIPSLLRVRGFSSAAGKAVSKALKRIKIPDSSDPAPEKAK
jgi:HEAT repeat protein